MQNETIYAVGKYYSMEVGLKSIVDIPISGSFFVEISWLDSFHGRCCSSCSGPPPAANPEPPICGGYGFVASPVCGKCAYLWYFPEIFVTWYLFFFVIQLKHSLSTRLILRWGFWCLNYQNRQL